MSESKKNLAFDLSLHFIVTVILCGLVYWKFGDIFYAGLCLAGGIFIDLDHLFDYFKHYKLHISFKKFIRTEFLQSGKVYLPFHSWEIIFILFLLSLYFKSDGLGVFSLAMGVHLLIDHFQSPNRLFYFLTYRIIKKFDLEQLRAEAVGHKLYK